MKSLKPQEQPQVYRATTSRTARKQAGVVLILALTVLALLFLVFLIWLSVRPQPRIEQATGLEETATAFAQTATAFAAIIDMERTPSAPLSLPEVEATSTAIIQALQTAQPLLFPTPEPGAITATPEP